MTIPATILLFPASWGGEDCAGVAAAAAFDDVEDSALEERLAEGGDRPAEKRGTQG
jgi:hypothetical protein